MRPNSRIFGARLQRATIVGLAGALVAPGAATTAHADPSLAEIAAEIQALKAENRQIKVENQKMKAAIANIGAQTHRTSEKVRAVASRAERVAATPAAPALPEGAVPAFITANKQLQFGAITITPGGFIAADNIYRTRTTQSDINTAWNSIPTDNNGLAHIGEEKMTGRASRFALLAESQITPTALVAGYGEFDLQGAGTTSNNNQSYSYVPRVRNLYSTLDLNDYGIHVLAGQSWSLVTLNSKGITPRNEVTPPTIDAGYMPGFEYTRAPQIRLVKDFGGKLWLGLEAEASAAEGINNGLCGNVVSNNSTVAATTTGVSANAGLGILGGNCLAVGTGGNFGQQGDQTQYSLNKVPDVIGKVAYELNVGNRDIHLEGFGLYRDYLDNVAYGVTAPATSTFAAPGGYTSGSNQNTTGYGVGGGLVVPVVPRYLDVQASGIVGRGIGRYTSSQLPDATITGNGALKPLGGAAALVGAIAHATPSIDVYAFAGFEQVNRDYGTSAGAFVGYGAPGGVNNYGCNVEGGTCTGATHRIFQVTGGMWDKLYKGSYGEVRVGLQYSYTQRDLFAGTINANGIPTTAAPLISAKANDNLIETSFRYYPFN